MSQTTIERLREKMRQQGIAALLVLTADDHESEYVADHFKVRQFLSGFTGSAGTLVITLQTAGCWTDGRYFIQAEKQLKGSGISLFRMGQPGVTDFFDFLVEHTPQNGKVAVEKRQINSALAERLQAALACKGAQLVEAEALISEIWPNRPAMPSGKAFCLKETFSGKSAEQKLKELRKGLAEKQAEVHLISALDEIAWLFNLRGQDVLHTPVVYAFAWISQSETRLYLEAEKLTDAVREKLEEVCQIYPYAQFYTDLTQLKGQRILLDKEKMNFAAVSRLDGSNQIMDEAGLIGLAKAIKNPVEIKNLRRCHLQDGAAMTELIFWLKTQVSRQVITELSAAEYLRQRRFLRGALDESFTTIAAYNDNAAMMHYSVVEENAQLKPAGMLLVDSGGQYWEGTTDITRTIALGPVPSVWIRYYTAVLKGMIALSRCKFLYGCTGLNLDILARGPIWQMDLDYQCGTGHGVGYLLSVHEGPQGIRWKKRGLESETPLKAGMVVTNEPGLYLEKECGIRIENELLVKTGVKNFYGQFMEFETLTLAPIDRELIDASALSEEELAWLNAYHERVDQQLAPLLEADCAAWLHRVTRPILRKKAGQRNGNSKPNLF